MPTIFTDAPKLSATDLVIHEFDLWSNPNAPALSPCACCWAQDIGTELTE